MTRTTKKKKKQDSFQNIYYSCRYFASLKSLRFSLSILYKYLKTKRCGRRKRIGYTRTNIVSVSGYKDKL